MRDLITWFRAVLDEDETAAKAATQTSGHHTWNAFGIDGDNTETKTWSVESPGEDGPRLDGGLFQRTGHRDLVVHVAAHDPAAVLADVEAKRGILNALTVRVDIATRSGAALDRDPLAFAVRTLAQAYRHRPGWNTDWE
jgi:hypothetical protein